MTPRGRALLGAWAPPAGWALLIFGVSSLPIRGPGESIPGSDKVVHGVEFAVLGALLARALAIVRPGRPPAAALLPAALLATGFGLSDEIHQLFVPERAFEWGDLLADAVGGGIGAAAWIAWRVRRRGSGGSPAPRPSASRGP